MSLAKPPPLKKEARETGGALLIERSFTAPGQEDDLAEADTVDGYLYGGESAAGVAARARASTPMPRTDPRVGT